MGKPNITILLKKHSNIVTPNDTAIPVLQGNTQASLEKFLLLVDDN